MAYTANIVLLVTRWRCAIPGTTGVYRANETPNSPRSNSRRIKNVRPQPLPRITLPSL